MEIQKNQVQCQFTLALLGIQGDLDASNYLDLVNKVRELHQGEIKQIILDLSQVRFISSSGVVGLYWSLLLMNGYQVQESEDGWNTLHAVVKESRVLQKRISLVSLQHGVDNTLDMAGIKNYFEIYSDMEQYCLENGLATSSVAKWFGEYLIIPVQQSKFQNLE